MRALNIFINDNFLLLTLFAIFTTHNVWNIFHSLYSVTAMCIFWVIVLMYNNSFITKDGLYRKGRVDGENGKELVFEDKLYYLGHSIGQQQRLKKVYSEYSDWGNDE